jgi:hypothetical protein
MRSRIYEVGVAAFLCTLDSMHDCLLAWWCAGQGAPGAPERLENRYAGFVGPRTGLRDTVTGGGRTPACAVSTLGAGRRPLDNGPVLAGHCTPHGIVGESEGGGAVLSILGEGPQSRRSCPTRRELLRVGGLTALGLSAGGLERLRALADPGSPAVKYRQNSCLFIFLFGGPSHIDLWDMKPGAPAEIRGEFRPVATAVPGIQLCEHLPLLARAMGSLCLLRSMTHQMPVHGPACSEMYTGRPYPGPPTTDQARPEDWPSLASLVTRFGPKGAGWPPSVVLPWYTHFAGQDRPIAGQVGVRMGGGIGPSSSRATRASPGSTWPAFDCPRDCRSDASRPGMH